MNEFVRAQTNLFDKGNNKITELRTILQGNVKTHKYINKQNVKYIITLFE